MNVYPSSLPEVLILEPEIHTDSRGYFIETWNARRLETLGFTQRFVQDNHSRSNYGVLRGLHFQHPYPQGKLVHATRGAIFSVAVDVRIGSPWFAKWVAIELNDVNHRLCYVPPGYAYGYCVIGDYADVLYKCTEHYFPENEHGIAWNDPQINIEWPMNSFTLSARDNSNLTLDAIRAELPSFPSPR